MTDDAKQDADYPLYSYMPTGSADLRVTVYKGSLAIHANGRVTRKPLEAWDALAADEHRVERFPTVEKAARDVIHEMQHESPRRLGVKLTAAILALDASLKIEPSEVLNPIRADRDAQEGRAIESDHSVGDAPGVARSDAREDMANVGEAFMARLPKDFHWNECPTEYVIRLLDDAEELANALRDVLAGHPVRNADELIQRYSPLPIEPSGVPRP